MHLSLEVELEEKRNYRRCVIGCANREDSNHPSAIRSEHSLLDKKFHRMLCLACKGTILIITHLPIYYLY